MQHREHSFNSLSRDHRDVGAAIVTAAYETFNSLSRDHIYVSSDYDVTAVFELSIPSLGITVFRVVRGCMIALFRFQFPLSGSLNTLANTNLILKQISFNSLSRDHRNFKWIEVDVDEDFFQFPLSGSQLYESIKKRYTWLPLSIPSLGITTSASQSCIL